MGIRNYLCGIALIFAMCSCGPAKVEIGHNEHSIMKEFDRIRHFEYKGHKYISFETHIYTDFARMGIVHDPDCSCNSIK